MPDTILPRTIPHNVAEPLIKFLQSASPDEIESLLSLQHAYLQAGRAERALAHTRHVLARDAS
jgi:hypothetical protein